MLMQLYFPKNKMLEDYKKELLDKGTITLKVKVHAGAHETKIKSILTDGTIKIDIAKVPENGKANNLLIILLSEEFEVPKANIEIIMGAFSSDKVIKISQ